MRQAPIFLLILLASPSVLAQTAKPRRTPQPTLSSTPTGKAAAAVAPPPPAPQPPPPPPWVAAASNPTSVSGEALIPPQGAAAPAPAPPPPAPVVPPLALQDVDLPLRVAALEARIAADEKAKSDTELPDWLHFFHASGFIQPQLLIQSYNSAGSPNVLPNGQLPPGISANDVIAKSNGTTTNGDYFRLRRARLKLEFQPSDYARVVFEVDPTPAGGAIGGTGTIARQVEAQGIAHLGANVVMEFAMGVFKLPFGFEVLQSDADRPFIERSWGEQNMTPGEFDTGARMYTKWKHDKQSLDVQLALVNGQTEGEPSFSLDPDLTRSKDFVGRLAYAYGGFDIGGSGYYGEGQNVDPVGLRYKQFERWAVNGELNIGGVLVPKLGSTKIFAEATYGQNMDRGVHYAFAVPAIPTTIANAVTNLNEISVWARLEQDITQWTTFGARWDMYTPDASQGSDARNTFSFVGVVHMTPGLQTMLEFDHAIDQVHLAGKEVPTRQIEMGSLVLQGRF